MLSHSLLVIGLDISQNEHQNCKSEGRDVLCFAQDVDTGEVLMQAYSDRAGIAETLETR